MALKLSARLGHIDISASKTLEDHLASIGLRTKPKQVREIWNADALMKHMAQDKKAEHGKLAFVLAKKMGEVFVDKDVPQAEVQNVLEQELR